MPPASLSHRINRIRPRLSSNPTALMHLNPSRKSGHPLVLLLWSRVRRFANSPCTEPLGHPVPIAGTRYLDAIPAVPGWLACRATLGIPPDRRLSPTTGMAAYAAPPEEPVLETPDAPSSALFARTLGSLLPMSLLPPRRMRTAQMRTSVLTWPDRAPLWCLLCLALARRLPSTSSRRSPPVDSN